MHPYEPAKLLQGPLEGQLTVVAGLHGSGKTALFAGLASWLQAQKVNAVVIDEPDFGRTAFELEDQLRHQALKARELGVHVLVAYTNKGNVSRHLREIPNTLIVVTCDWAPLESVAFTAAVFSSTYEHAELNSPVQFNPAELHPLAPKG